MTKLVHVNGQTGGWMIRIKDKQINKFKCIHMNTQKHEPEQTWHTQCDTHTYIITQQTRIFTNTLTHAYAFTNMYINAQIHKQTYSMNDMIYMYTRTNTRTHACMHVRTHTHILAQTHNYVCTYRST